MANLFQPSIARALDSNGNPISGAKLKFFATGTTTLQAVFSNQSGTTEAQNPVPADAVGLFPAIYLDKSSTYRVVLATASDATIWDIDPVKGFDESQLATDAAAASAAAISTAADALATASDVVTVTAAKNATIAAADGLTDGIPSGATVAAGGALASDGDNFFKTPDAGDMWPLFLRNSATAYSWVGWRTPTESGLSQSASISAARLRTDRSKYEWHFGHSYDGRWAVNTGLYGDIAPEPDYRQLMGAGNIMYDNDGGTSGVRLPWPDGVTNTIGVAEIVELEFSSANHDFTLAYKFDFTGLTANDYDLYISIRKTSGETAQAMTFGASSASGTRTSFTPTDDFGLQAVNLGSWSDASSWSAALEPDSFVATFKVDVEMVGILPKGVNPPSITDLRDSYFAGHAMAPLASGDASFTGGSFIPTAKCPNLVSTLRGEVISTHLRMSAYLSLPDTESGIHGSGEPYSTSGAYPLAFAREGRTAPDNVSLHTEGALLVRGGVTDIEYFGRFAPNAGDDGNQGLTQAPAMVIPGNGVHRLDVVLEGVGNQSRHNSNQANDGDRIFKIFMNGRPQSEYPSEGMPDDYAPRVVYHGGLAVNNTKVVAPLANQNTLSPNYVHRLDFNSPNSDGADTAAMILAETQDDIATGKVTLPPTIAEITWEGDSTSRFSGNPCTWMAQEMAASGVQINNISQGGSLYVDSDPVPDTNAFNHPDRILFRNDVLSAAKALGGGAPHILLYHGGENGPTHLSPAADAYADVRALMPAEGQAIDPTNTINVIVDVRPSGVSGVAGRTQKDEFNAYVAARFTQSTAISYLWINPTATADDFKYLIKLSAWAPRHPDHSETYTDWDDCLGSINAINGDNVHFTGTDGGKYAAVDVFTPSTKEIFRLERGLIL